jgi:hypothetical protein
MGIVAVTSAKGSPGVTTCALALTLTWPRDVLLVEADPAGGDILAGYVRAELRGDRGLAFLAVAARHDRMADELATELAAQVVGLSARKNGPSRLLLPGIGDPAQAVGVAAAWPTLARFFARLDPGSQGAGSEAGGPAAAAVRDVIVDCGRLAAAYPPIALISAADVVLLVVRTSLRSAASAASAVAALRHELASRGGDPDRLALVVVDSGEYRPADLARSLGAPIMATIPWREREAAALSDGIGRAPESSVLMRAARTAAEAMIRRLTRAAATPVGPESNSGMSTGLVPVERAMPPGPALAGPAPTGAVPTRPMPSGPMPTAVALPPDRQLPWAPSPPPPAGYSGELTGGMPTAGHAPAGLGSGMADR